STSARLRSVWASRGGSTVRERTSGATATRESSRTPVPRRSRGFSNNSSGARRRASVGVKSLAAVTLRARCLAPRRPHWPGLRETTPPLARRRAYHGAMCRNIHTLFNFEPPATDEEARDAALQYVRKISGFTKPSRANEAAFARAVDEVALASTRLLDELVTSAAPRSREVEAERAPARAAKRFAAA